MTSAILTGSLLTKETGHHESILLCRVTWRRFRRRESKVGSNFALEPRQRADCDENKLRLVRAPGDRRTGHDDDAEATSFLAPQNHRSQASAFDALSDEEKAAALDVQKERPQRVRAKRAVSLSLATQIFKLYDAGHTVDEIATIVSRRPISIIHFAAKRGVFLSRSTLAVRRAVLPQPGAGGRASPAGGGLRDAGDGGAGGLADIFAR